MSQQNIKFLNTSKIRIIICIIIFLFINRHLNYKNLDGLIIADLIGQIIGMIITLYVIEYLFVKRQQNILQK